MTLPESPPSFESLLSGLANRAEAVFTAPVGAEVGGRYLHWDDLRRRPPPHGLSVQEWWLRISLSRAAQRTLLPLKDAGHRQIHFARTESLQRLLHDVDRKLVKPLDASNPRAPTLEMRERYVIRSLAEEAITSSQLEGASTTRKVAQEMLLSGRAPRGRDERMIANNFRAMELVRSRCTDPLSLELLLELHAVLTEGTFVDPRDVGRFRRADETVAVTDLGDGTVLHVPPDAAELEERVAALCRFANEGEEDAFVHPVVRAIVLHFALAYDHPFVDGNGRTARALFYWSMLRQGYGLAEFLSISRVIRKAPSQYGKAFLYSETDSGDVTYFLLHQLQVIRTAIDDLSEYLKHKASEVRDAERLLNASRDLNPRQQALVAHALRHPDARYTIDGYRREYDVAYATARADLLALASQGLLQQKKLGRRFYFDAPPKLADELKRKPRSQGG